MTSAKATIGADPEFFVQRNDTKEIVPVVGLLGGTKEKPRPISPKVEDLRNLGVDRTAMIVYNPYLRTTSLLPALAQEGFAVQEDNVMAELNIPPSTSTYYFDASLAAAMVTADKMLKSKGYSLVTQVPFHEFESSALDSPQAQLIGCEPDQDAYKMGEVRGDPPALDNMRHCGGHIHVGGNFNCPTFVAVLILESQLLTAGPSFRPASMKSWYRRPGSFRSKPYGFEYRTPDNSWLYHSDLRISVGDIVLRTATYLQRTPATAIQEEFRKVNWAALRQALVDNDEKMLAKIRISLRGRFG